MSVIDDYRKCSDDGQDEFLRDLEFEVMASKNFVNDSEALKALIVETVLDAKEDIDIRHNAYAAVRAFFDIAGRKVVLEKLSADAEMGPHTRRDLASFECGSEG